MKSIKTILELQISFRASALVLATVLLGAGAFEIKALVAKEPTSNHAKKFNEAECVRCHSDQKTISIMRMKEDGTGFLFNKDGTFKDPKLARLNPTTPKPGAVDLKPDGMNGSSYVPTK